jgi:hypothetical protein
MEVVKRGHKTRYDALFGVAAMIKMLTGKYLFICVHNKYCCICAWAKKTEVELPEHTCCLNCSTTSTSMEADNIVECFLKSEDMHKYRYGRIVADSDSSTYKRIKEATPYN